MAVDNPEEFTVRWHKDTVLSNWAKASLGTRMTWLRPITGIRTKLTQGLLQAIRCVHLPLPSDHVGRAAVVTAQDTVWREASGAVLTHLVDHNGDRSSYSRVMRNISVFPTGTTFRILR